MASATITSILPARSGALLDTCRQLAQSNLQTLICDVLTQGDDVLFNIANTADNSTRQNLYFDAMRELRLKRHDIEQVFLAQIDKNISDRLRPNKAGTRKPTRFAGELSLVALDEVEENLAISQFAKSMATRCGRDITALGGRLAVLLDEREFDDASNPLGPTAIGEALKCACQRLDSTIAIKLTVYKLFDKLAGHRLQGLYIELNQRLIEGNILPALPTQCDLSRPLRKTRVIIESEQEQFEASGDDVFSTLRALLQSGARANAGDAAQERRALPSIHYTGSRQTSVLNGKSGLLQPGFNSATGGSSINAGSNHGGFVSVPSLVDTLTVLQRNDALNVHQGTDGPAMIGPINILRDLRESSAIGQMAPTQDLTLEIVSLLFDYILDDPSIPDALKALICRLQIPILKVAILDKDVFSKKNHPARRLLDALAEAAVGWHEGLQRSDALYCKIEEIIRRVVSEFDDDVTLFSEVLEDFLRFKEQEDSAASDRAEAASRSLHTREQIVLAKLAADEELFSRTRGLDIREFVTQFLFDYWRQLLIITHVESGTSSEDWKGQLDAVDELVWSVQPKATPDDRKQLTARLPALLKVIKQGMRTLDMAPADCSRFLSMLASVHVVAIKQIEESSIASRRLAHIETERVAAEQSIKKAADIDPSSEEFIKQGLARLFERKGVEPQELDIDFSVFDVETGPAPEAEVHESSISKYVKLVTTLDLGDWVEFASTTGAPIRARFTWISPISGRYLFTDIHGEKMRELSMIELAKDLQSATATIIPSEPDPLLDRALGALIEKLEAEAAA